MVTPTKVLYIAIDGPAPLAKQAQQRQRRFAAALNPVFDSTVITPGTLFMFELTKYMNYMIRKEINGGKWRNITVIFSPPTVPGEGEHKIMDYIRTLNHAETNNSSHCMFGPDGDLIMLTLAAHLPHIHLFREDQYNPGFYDLLNMGMVRQRLPTVLSIDYGVSVGTRTIDSASDDFIFLGFLVGNDFLPKIQMFMYLEDGLNLMIATYARVSEKGTKNVLIDAKGDIRYASFIRFLEEIARREKGYILDQSKAKVIDIRFIDHTLLKNISDGQLNFADYRRDYYLKAGIDVSSLSGTDQVKKICIDYLRSIEWVFQYYIKGLKSWEHYYPWHYAPLMTDLLEVLKGMSLEEEKSLSKFDSAGQPSLPFVQLLSVVAPKNVGLLPTPFHGLMVDKESPLVKAGYYPIDFKIDYEGKTKEHMGVTLLPFIDVGVVRAAYQPIADTLRTTYVRNSKGVPAKFVYDKTYLADYISDYGELVSMRVRKIID